MQANQARRRVLVVDVAALRAGAAGALRSEWVDACAARTSPPRASSAAAGADRPQPDAGDWPDYARAGGGALGLAWLARGAHAGLRAPLVVSVGDCVKRGLPTAARASVAARAPLTGLFAEGLVGGDLARRLASVADALVVGSSAPRAGPPQGEALVIEADGSARLERDRGWCGLSPLALQRALRERFGVCAVLAVGPAGLAGVRWSNLAASGDSPHFVGRGGLGAVLGASGLSAVCVRAPALASQPDPLLTRALLSSPRLLSRARGGTLEQFEALAASGELRARGFATPVDAQAAQAIAREVDAARAGVHGCAGCPTPCGWVFRAPAGESAGAAQGARFGASYALGLNLGLEHFDDVLALLAVCDELGLDAKEAGAGLALLARAAEGERALGAPRFGDRAGFERLLREAVSGASELGELLALGPAAVAQRFDLAEHHTCAKGASLRPDENLAVLLGQCVSSRGGDSMRTFAFQGFDAAGIREWSARGGFELSAAAFDPRAPADKGLLVAWHEDWSNALDALGFCSFSAAALLCDGVLGLDELERLLAPERALCDGPGALLRLGAELSLAQRDLNASWGARDEDERPSWARGRARLDAPGLLPQYLAVRRAQRAGRWSAAPPRAPQRERAVEPALEPPRRRPGTLRLRCVGAAAAALGRELELELELPCDTRELLTELARRFPAAAPALLAGERVSASVFRAGRALGADARVSAGDELEIVAVVSGG